MEANFIICNLGRLFMIVGFSMSIPFFTAMYYREDGIWVFGLLMAIIVLVGYLLYKILRPQKPVRMRLRDSYIMVTIGWICAAVVGMLPYLFMGTFPTVADAFFETMSGFTTVGASVLDNIEGTPRAVLMWRSTTHWIGGMGILVLFVAILSHLGTGAMQIYRAEASGPAKEKLLPRIADTAQSLWLIYIFNTGIIICLYLLAGMPLFDAVNHGFSAISTGGFSTKNLSIGAYQSPAIEWVTVFATFMAGVNYSLYFYLYRNKSLQGFRKSLEFKVYLGVTLTATLLIFVDILPQYQWQLTTALRNSAFQVTSILSTTGFVTCDFEQWPVMAQVVLVLLMTSGACAGSTTGGIKIDRHVILFQKALYEMKKFMHPRMVRHLRSNGKPLQPELILSVTTFFFIYMVIVAISIYLLCCMGADGLDSTTAVFSCLGGVGPSIGHWGPMESYSQAPAAAKWLLSFLMLLGRLEIYTVLIVLQVPLNWRNWWKRKMRSYSIS